MKEYITQNAVEISATGAKVAYAGAATAVLSGVTLNQVEVQLIGVCVGFFGVLGGLIINGIAKYYERKDRLQSMRFKNEWDGIERRVDGTR